MQYIPQSNNIFENMILHDQHEHGFGMKQITPKEIALKILHFWLRYKTEVYCIVDTFSSSRPHSLYTQFKQ